MEHIGSYRELHRTGELASRADAARARLHACDLCAHQCRADRRAGQHGFCRAGDRILVADYGRHFGEEDVLVGRNGSGTVFFAGCNLRCVFCQNWQISQARLGETVSVERLAEIFLELQEMGSHNINLVTPTPYLPQILAALELASRGGLRLPLVYNCGGYEAPVALELLDRVVDIYMPDVKFAQDEVGRRLSGAEGYFAAAKAALKEMHRQVGDLQVDRDGLAWRGLLVRHLVLPGGLAGTEDVLRFMAEEISLSTFVNLMAQYRPSYLADEHPPLDRPLTTAEYQAALAAARRVGLTRLAR